ncbi:MULTISPECIES: tRNA epoxyqueuosine(34) reductase QueG [unclassified Xanthobacter]|uniref:tRNA epoxyqueuosine(34) reductase QueG n=1 Tax=unclassified Xanthobacter TaxID=2623496 RepID=UPI001F1C51DE|nr:MULTISPECIES: tRNA epoxyqueuosine(34) reductase QueG [unclassified Xanthobacter]
MKTPPTPAALRARLEELARAEGFDAIGIADPRAIAPAGARLAQWVASGAHGDMGWMAETLERRADPLALWPDMRAVIMLGLNYGPEQDPRAAQADAMTGALSVYARGEDYHEIIKPKLKRIARALLAAAGEGDVKVFVDTAPLMEKPLAAAAGLGWQGKHTNMVSRAFGSWLFLGAIATTLELPFDTAERDHCGSCRACLEACPTAAFPAPYQIDARRCVSYLTIELKGPIPRDLRPLIGNRIYGCDDCLAACPWNKFAVAGREVKLAARAENEAPRLLDLVSLDDAAFRARFPKSPIKRVGRDRFIRNVLIAMGNSGDAGFAEAAGARLADPSPLVRSAAVWALARLLPVADFQTLASRHAPLEEDAEVRGEWDAEGGA